MNQLLNTKINIFAKKSLGQNFIHDQNFLEKLINNIQFEKFSDLVEVGPGKGALTDKLLERSFNKIFLIEKDDRLIEYLKKKYLNERRVNIIHSDALKIDYTKITKSDKVTIIGNLPFNISSQLLVKWLSSNKWPPFYSKMYLMFQYELGERIISEKDSKKYGRISVLSQSRCDISKVLIAPSSIFNPKPKVNGIVLEFIPNNNSKDLNFENLSKILEIAFRNRRKKIKNCMREYSSFFNNWEKIKDYRPENLGIEEYCELAKKFN